jgi:hypothetical protein
MIETGEIALLHQQEVVPTSYLLAEIYRAMAYVDILECACECGDRLLPNGAKVPEWISLLRIRISSAKIQKNIHSGTFGLFLVFLDLAEQIAVLRCAIQIGEQRQVVNVHAIEHAQALFTFLVWDKKLH